MSLWFPNLCSCHCSVYYTEAHLSLCSRVFSTLRVSAPWSLVMHSCARADSFIATCCRLPLSQLKVIVPVPNRLKFTLFPRSCFKPFKTHISVHLPLKKPNASMTPEVGQFVTIVLKSQRPVDFPLSHPSFSDQQALAPPPAQSTSGLTLGQVQGCPWSANRS